MLSSPVEIAIVAGVVLLVFGPKKIPELGKSLGQGLGNFKKALNDAQDEVTNAVETTDGEEASSNNQETETEKSTK